MMHDLNLKIIKKSILHISRLECEVYNYTVLYITVDCRSISSKRRSCEYLPENLDFHSYLLDYSYTLSIFYQRRH